MNAPTTSHTASTRVEVRDVMHLSLPAYEGPLDLLLELIRKHEVDIFDIPIALITEEYLAYVDTMGALDLVLGGEWIEMAAMLVYLKSRMLLPKEEKTDDEEEGPDPREELIERLIAYQRFKAAAERLEERPMLGRHVFTAPSRAGEFASMLGPPKLREASLGDLMGALKKVIARSKDDGQWVLELSSQKLTLRSVMVEIAEKLASQPRIAFDELFEDHELTRHRIITTFLALLEMTKLKMVKLFQSRLDGVQLFVERAVIDIVEVSQELELSY